MTQHKHLKTMVRARMARTGERYAAARRHVVGADGGAGGAGHAPPPTTPSIVHFAGSVPAATALRTLLAARGVAAAHTGAAPSEALVYGIAGGIGIGVFQFHYAKENVGTFFLGARHRWDDDLAYLTAAAARCGFDVRVDETGGARTAAAQLDARLADGPVIAWLDLASLPHRALPAADAGSGYHVAVVQGRAAAHGSDAYVVSDAGDGPLVVGADDLARARGRIAKQRHRLLALGVATPPGIATADGLVAAVRAGIAAGADGLVTSPRQGYAKNFTLDGLALWAERLRGGGKDAWAQVFPPGPRLWDACLGVHDWIEGYGTGGGLGRPLFAAFLTEAADVLADPSLLDTAAHYAALGADWTALAEAAMPAGVPLFDAARAWFDARAACQTAAGAGEPAVQAAVAEAKAAWAALEAARADAAAAPPLAAADGQALCAALAERVAALHAAEQAGQAMLARA